MPKLIELREKRAQQIAEAQRILLADTLDAEKRAQATTMVADVEQMEKDIDALEKLEAMEQRSAATQKPNRPNPDGSIEGEVPEAAKAEERAFEKYLRYGMEELDADERKALRGQRLDGRMAFQVPKSVVQRAFPKQQREQRDLLTTGSAGDLIPQGFLPTLIDASLFIGNLTTAVRKKVTNNNGAPIKIALSNDTANSLTTLTAEATVVTEQDPAFSGVVSNTDTVATLVKVSVQELDDSYFQLPTWLRDKFGLRYLRGLESLIPAGNGSNISSLVTGAHAANTTTAATGPVFEDFTTCYGTLDPSYLPNAKWAMSQTTRVYVMGLLDTLNRPLFIPSPNSGTLDQILGHPILISQALPPANVAANVGVLFGDFNEGYLLRTDGDVNIVRLNERYMDTLEVGFLAYARIGGISTDAGTHPLLKMTTHA
jgi:HK97 family phage major capsid protein